MIISIFFVEKKSTSHDNQFKILSLLKKIKIKSTLPLALVWGFIFLLDSPVPLVGKTEFWFLSGLKNRLKWAEREILNVHEAPNFVDQKKKHQILIKKKRESDWIKVGYDTGLVGKPNFICTLFAP